MLTKKITRSRVGLVCLGFSEINKRILELENELSKTARPIEIVDKLIEKDIENEMRILRELRKNETRAKNDN